MVKCAFLAACQRNVEQTLGMQRVEGVEQKDSQHEEGQDPEGQVVRVLAAQDEHTDAEEDQRRQCAGQDRGHEPGQDDSHHSLCASRAFVRKCCEGSAR